MDETILTAREAVFRYQPRADPAVAGISLTVSGGASLGIVGESGSGKTTVGRLLVGALTPESGMVAINGRPWKEVKRTDPLRGAVQMVFQDPYGSLNPALTAHQAVAEACRVTHGLRRAAASARANELLEEVGLGGATVRRKPASLSGGQCQRVGIARALACDPAVLADEPTSSLDVSVQAQILNLLLDLRERRRLALVLISHDLAVVAHMTEQALVMYRGHVVEQGRTASLLRDPRHPYTKGLIDSLPESPVSPQFARNGVDSSRGCVFAERCTQFAAGCASQQPPLRQLGTHEVACWHPLAGDGEEDLQSLECASGGGGS